MWEQQKMLPKMNKKLKFITEITISDNNFWKYCVFWMEREWLKMNGCQFWLKIKFFQANFLKIVLIWNDLTCWLWLDFLNLPHFLSDFVGIWNDLQCWYLLGIPKSSTHSERFTANCQDLEFFHFFFHRFWLDLECLNCWFWLEFQNLPHLFYIVFLKIVWIWNDLTLGIPKSFTGGMWILNGIAQSRPVGPGPISKLRIPNQWGGHSHINNDTHWLPHIWPYIFTPLHQPKTPVFAKNCHPKSYFCRTVQNFGNFSLTVP